MDLVRFLLRLPFLIISTLFRALVFILWLLKSVLKPIVDNIVWQSPAWWGNLADFSVQQGALITIRS